ncbi:MAG: hypothetical protein LBH25_01470 [Fibromonadaceae bacterium]|jgi:uncharacterized protein (TIGR02145 family)|nr:hypothetical protein [Fibromonadaceae bacterium]
MHNYHYKHCDTIKGERGQPALFTATLVLAITFILSGCGEHSLEDSLNLLKGESSSSVKDSSGDKDGGYGVSSSSFSSSSMGDSGEFVDSRDGKTYKYVKIGDHVWMAENLNYKTAGCKCYGNLESNCAKYGRLCDWAMSMALPSSYNNSYYYAGHINCERSSLKHQGICPTGWHLPSYAEWNALHDYVESSNGCTLCVGKHLKAVDGWNSYLGQSGNGLDTYGFSALPGGLYDWEYGFVGVGGGTGWWSSTEWSCDSPESSFRMSLVGNGSDFSGNGKFTYFLSIRCVKD